ncbi:hypothetical protein ABIF68_006773 [Bradyrhizobium japonicum]
MSSHRNRKPEAALVQDRKKFELKEWAVFIPTFTTALSLAWQVGALLPAGGFAFFSISDHLVSSARALPMALSTSSGVAVLYAVVLSGRPPQELIRFATWATRCGLVLTVLVFAAISLSRYLQTELPFETTALIAVGSIMGAGLLIKRSADGNLMLFVVFCLLTMLSTSVATDLTRMRLTQIDKREIPLASITGKSGVSKGYILMSGERGILVYTPGGAVAFVRSDEVTMIDYPLPKRFH